MKNGQCPKCGSTNVYTRRQGIEYERSMKLGIIIRTAGGTMPSPLDNYICTGCGYFESYIADERKLDDVASNWDKVG